MVSSLVPYIPPTESSIMFISRKGINPTGFCGGFHYKTPIFGSIRSDWRIHLFCNGDYSSNGTSLWESLAQQYIAHLKMWNTPRPKRVSQKLVGEERSAGIIKFDKQCSVFYCIYKPLMLFYTHPHYALWPSDMWKKLEIRNSGKQDSLIILLKKDIIHSQTFRRVFFLF